MAPPPAPPSDTERQHTSGRGQFVESEHPSAKPATQACPAGVHDRVTPPRPPCCTQHWLVAALHIAVPHGTVPVVPTTTPLDELPLLLLLEELETPLLPLLLTPPDELEEAPPLLPEELEAPLLPLLLTPPDELALAPLLAFPPLPDEEPPPAVGSSVTSSSDRAPQPRSAVIASAGRASTR